MVVASFPAADPMANPPTPNIPNTVLSVNLAAFGQSCRRGADAVILFLRAHALMIWFVGSLPLVVSEENPVGASHAWTKN